MSLFPEIINPLERADWNDLIGAMPGTSFFHSSNWARVLSATYDYEPLYFCIVEGGRLSALVPLMDVRSFLTGRRGVSLPFTDYCAPVFHDKAYKNCLLESMRDYGRKRGWKYIEFRGGDNLAKNAACYHFYYGHTMSLAGSEEEFISRMRDSTARNVRKALKLGVRTEISTSRESLGEFYRLNCITRKKHGLPPQPFPFFRNIHEHILSKNLGMVVLASCGSRYVAGGVFFRFGDDAIYKYGASDPDYQELRPNNLVMWEAIRRYADEGCKTLNLGRTDQEAAGLRQYKTGWGANEQIIRYFRYDPVHDCFAGNCSPERKPCYDMFRWLPIPLLKMAGNALYRHMG